MSQPTQKFTPIADSDLAAAVAELAAVVGEAEANTPKWLRRLVRLTDTGAVGLSLSTCCAINDPDERERHPWTHQGGLDAISVAYPLKEAVAILNSNESPELEVSRRRRLFEAWNAEKAAQAEKQRIAQEQEAARAKQEREDAVRFNERSWEADYSELGRTLLALAVMCEGRDRALADDLRVLADHQRVQLGNLTNRLDFPRCEWNPRPSVKVGWQWWLRATEKPSV